MKNNGITAAISKIVDRLFEENEDGILTEAKSLFPRP
jgi:hypothetical protein